MAKRKAYDTSSRSEKSSGLRQKVIQTYIDLLVAGRGEEVAVEDVVKRSGVSARSIFRFFEDKSNLSLAAGEYVQTYLAASAEQLSEKSVPEFAQYVFEQFEKHENLTLAYIYTRFGQSARSKFRARFNQLLTQKILASKGLKLTREREMKIAVMVTLINAKLWHDIKTGFDIDGDEIAPYIKDALVILLKALD